MTTFSQLALGTFKFQPEPPNPLVFTLTGAYTPPSGNTVVITLSGTYNPPDA